MRKRKELPYTDDDISLFISRFTTGHWAMQGDVNLDKGTTQYIPPSEKGHLTPNLVKKHLDTEITLAGYTITRENTCRFLVIDFDIDSITAKLAIGSPGSAAFKKARKDALIKIREEVSDAVIKISDILKISRDQMLIERSGVKGYHIWVFFEEDVPARDAYRLTRILSTEIGLKGYEIYPMQPSGNDTSPGSLIKLPLGVNRKNWERCLFLDDNFEAVPEGQWAALQNVVPISSSQMSDLMKLKDTEADRVEDDDIDDVSKIGGSIDTMINSCAALTAIKEKALNASKDDGYINLSHDERLCILSLFAKFGVVGKSRIHEFLQNTDNYDHEKTNKHIEGCDLIPMRCDTMRDRGICDKECDNIIRCNGKSPIKLAMTGDRRGKEGVYVLNSLAEIENPIICNKQVRVDFTVNSLIDSPFYSTKKLSFKACSPTTCPDFEEKCGCPQRDAIKTVKIPTSSKMHIQMYGVDDKKALSLLKGRIVGCTKPDKLQLHGKAEKFVVQPFTCSNIVYSVDREKMEEQYAEEDLVSKAKEDAAAGNETVAAKEMKDYMTFFLGSTLETSKIYRGYGTVLPNPHNQSITLLFDKVEPLDSQIDNFKIDDTNIEDFEKFKALTLEEIIDDLNNNVAFIYGRSEVTLAILLTHFSVLGFSFNNTPVSKGWVDSLIIGDTGQAKSLLVNRILDYIGLGNSTGANISYAGLLGGIERVQNKSYINWGLIPRCNKGLVFLDEIQNLKSEIMYNLRTVRGDGFAEVTKIVKGRHEAKVRLICAANPMPASRNMSDFKYGAMSLLSVPGLGGPDIRRFDIACFVNAADTNKDDINKFNKAKKPLISRNMIRTAVLWAWARKPEDIIFSEAVTRRILEGAGFLSDKYDVSSAGVSLCNTGDMRESLARLTVSLAAVRLRTPDNVRLIPEVKDVEDIINYLDSVYSHPSVKLDVLVAEKRRESDMDEAQFEELKSYMNTPGYEKMHKVIIGFLDIGVQGIRAHDLGGWAQASGDEMSRIVAVLNKYQLITMSGFGAYSPTPKLSKLNSMLIEDNQAEGGIENDSFF